jgi:4-diphosphocytidyl-2-C-methyl-D-erythritol kinase
MTPLATERAPAKLNLCLFLGPTRADGRHELVTVFDSVDLADELEVVASSADEVSCEGVAGPNLVLRALEALRAAGWEASPVRVTIDKRIPVAAGLGGGSADAAAMLRCASRLAPVSDERIREIAASLGADVPGQLRPGVSLGTGAGELIQPLPAFEPYGVLVVPQPFGLLTPDVFREADRLGLLRSSAELEALAERVVPVPPAELFINDLQAAALSLAPAIEAVLESVCQAGADRALVCGSGPTVIGLFWGPDAAARTRHAADQIPGGIAAAPVAGGVGSPAPKD